MLYLIAILEGVITFISPCLLPMLPIYLTYFSEGEHNKKSVAKNSIGFILGFTIIFVTMGAFAGSLGKLFREYSFIVNILSGTFVIILGLSFMEIFAFKWFHTTKRFELHHMGKGFFSSVIFGLVFAVGWTPCVGAFLGSILAMVSQNGEFSEGVLALTFYSIGLGIPFFISALLVDTLKGTFQVIKRNYKIINRIAGAILVLLGILMMIGKIGILYQLFADF